MHRIRLSFGNFLVFSIVTLFLFAFFQSNMEALGWESSEISKWVIWKFELLDLRSSGLLLLAAISVAYTRNQFEYGLRPTLDYRCQINSQPAIIEATASCFTTRLTNVGGGLAAVLVSSYTLKFKNEDQTHTTSYQGLVALLEKNGLRIEKDYDVVCFSTGWTLGAGEERVIFELNLENIAINDSRRKLQQLDIELQFEGRLKDRYIKRIYCIPRRGIVALDTD